MSVAIQSSPRKGRAAQPIQSELPLTGTQEKAVRQFREHLGSAGGSSVSDTELIRFLLARKWEVDRAMKLRANYYELQSDLGFCFRRLDIELVRRELEKEKMAIYGRDKRGARVVSFHAARHFPKESPLDILLPYMMYWMEYITNDVDTQVNGVVFLADMTGFSLMKNFDVKAEKFFITTIQDHFPMRIRRMLILNAPTTFSIALKILKPFMKKKLREKITQVYSNHELSEYIDPSDLPPEFGGTYEHDHQTVIQNLKPNLDAEE